MAGRKPTITALKLVKGNPGKRAISKDEPQYGPGIPDRPVWLKDPVAVTEWKRVSKLLDDAGVITVADGQALAVYCYIISQIALLSEKVAENGYLAYDIKLNADTGEEIMVNPKVNPHSVRLEKFITELRPYSALFGLDPANRTKIHSEKKPEAKPAGKEKYFK